MQHMQKRPLIFPFDTEVKSNDWYVQPGSSMFGTSDFGTKAVDFDTDAISAPKCALRHQVGLKSKLPMC